MLSECTLLRKQKASEEISRGCCFALICFLETLGFLGQRPGFFKADAMFLNPLAFLWPGSEKPLKEESHRPAELGLSCALSDSVWLHFIGILIPTWGG